MTTQHPTKSIERAAKGYTIVELLVVIAIITILASILVTVARSMLTTASEARCVANMKVWASAIHLHTTTHQGELPPLGQPGEPLYAATGALQGFFTKYDLSPRVAYPATNQYMQGNAESDQWTNVEITCYGAPDYASAEIVDDSQTIGSTPLPSPAYIIVDNNDPTDVEIYGSIWEETTPAKAYGEHLLLHPGGTWTGSNSVKWKYKYPYAQGLTYTVKIEVHYVEGPGRATTIPYECSHSEGAPVTAKRVSQASSAWESHWETLKDASTGSILYLKVTPGTEYYVKVSDASAGTGSETLVADAIRVTALTATGGDPEGQEAGFRTLMGAWTVVAPGDAYPVSNPALHRLDRSGGNTGSAEWLLPELDAGYYEVSLWWGQFDTKNTAVPHTIHHASGTTTVIVDQANSGVSGGGWTTLANVNFDSGHTYKIVLGVATGSGDIIVADAVRVAPRPYMVQSKAMMGYLWLGARTDPGGTLAPGVTLCPSNVTDAAANAPLLVDWITPEVKALWTHKDSGGHVLYVDGRVDFVHTDDTEARWTDDGDNGTQCTFYW